jgi:hypothetical protein
MIRVVERHNSGMQIVKEVQQPGGSEINLPPQIYDQILPFMNYPKNLNKTEEISGFFLLIHLIHKLVNELKIWE